MRGLACSLISDRRTRGARVSAANDRLVVEAPRGVLTESDRAALRTTKLQVMARLELESRLVGMSLDDTVQVPISPSPPGVEDDAYAGLLHLVQLPGDDLWVAGAVETGDRGIDYATGIGAVVPVGREELPQAVSPDGVIPVPAGEHRCQRDVGLTVIYFNRLSRLRQRVRESPAPKE